MADIQGQEERLEIGHTRLCYETTMMIRGKCLKGIFIPLPTFAPAESNRTVNVRDISVQTDTSQYYSKRTATENYAQFEVTSQNIPIGQSLPVASLKDYKLLNSPELNSVKSISTQTETSNLRYSSKATWAEIATREISCQTVTSVSQYIENALAGGSSQGQSNLNQLTNWDELVVSDNWNKVEFDESPVEEPVLTVPVTVNGSLGSSGSASETDLDLITDEYEDQSEFPYQAWVVTKEEPHTPSPPPVQQTDYELIEEPEYILSSEPVMDSPPTKKSRKQTHEFIPRTVGRIYPKPGFSYSCLIAMSLKNSKVGILPVSKIYMFMCDHFPYFKTAPSGWKNSVRHNLSANKFFEKIEKPGNGNAIRKRYLWTMNPMKIGKMDEEVQKWLKKNPNAVIHAMSDPENLELIERGELKRDYGGNGGGASDEDEEEEFTNLSHLQGS